jgi:hypothetical protein
MKVVPPTDSRIKDIAEEVPLKVIPMQHFIEFGSVGKTILSGVQGILRFTSEFSRTEQGSLNMKRRAYLENFHSLGISL